MILPTTHIHLTGELIDRKLAKFINEKVKIFKKKNLLSASFNDVIGELTDYELIVADIDAGGYCDNTNKIICLSDTELTPFQEAGLILHELGHAIQFELGVYEKVGNSLKLALRSEWQAESIAYILYNKLYGKADHTLFSSYFNKDDIDFFKEWTEGYYEDDLILDALKNKKDTFSFVSCYPNGTNGKK